MKGAPLCRTRYVIYSHLSSLVFHFFPIDVTGVSLGLSKVRYENPV